MLLLSDWRVTCNKYPLLSKGALFSRVVKLFDSYACQSPLLTHRLTLIQKLVTDF